MSGNTPPKPKITIVVQNFADQDLLPDAEVKRTLPFLQQQANEDFIDYWKTALDRKPTDVSLKFLHTSEPVPAGAWHAQIYDDAQDAIMVGGLEHLSDSDLGFHDLDSTRNLPYLIVLANTSHEAGVQWTAPFSHELLEAIADPTGVRTKLVGDTVYAFEVCDPVAPQSYPLGGVRVSNFVTPAWFDSEGSGPYDFLGALTAAGQLALCGSMTTIVAGQGLFTTYGPDGQFQTVPESLGAPGPKLRPRPRLARAAQAAALNNPQPTARVAAVESRVAMLESTLGFQNQSTPGFRNQAGTATACAMVCSMCSMVCSMCSMVCSMCSMVCSMCNTACATCSSCSNCGCCGCSGQAQAQGGGQAPVGLANLGYS